MATLSDVGINQRVSFKVYPSTILGDQFQDVILQGIVNAQMALTYGMDVMAFHANVYPTLPIGVPDDPYAYNYAMIRHPLSGAVEFIGEPWIIQETLKRSTGGRATLTFDNLTSTDVEMLRQAVAGNGFSPTEVKFTAE